MHSLRHQNTITFCISASNSAYASPSYAYFTLGPTAKPYHGVEIDLCSVLCYGIGRRCLGSTVLTPDYTCSGPF